LTREVIQQAETKRLGRQIMIDGSQPLEADRTRGLSYSLFNLEGLMDLAVLGEAVQVDLWHYQTQDGRNIRKALDYILPYAVGEKKWEHQQITDFKPREIVPQLLLAAVKLASPQYEKAGENIESSERDLSNLLLQAQFKRLRGGEKPATAER